jgi:hypothetical protein
MREYGIPPYGACSNGNFNFVFEPEDILPPLVCTSCYIVMRKLFLVRSVVFCMCLEQAQNMCIVYNCACSTCAACIFLHTSSMDCYLNMHAVHLLAIGMYLE